MGAFLFSIGIVSVCLFMFGINLDLMWLRLLAKPLPILALILWVGFQNKSSYKTRMLVGLILCVIADMLLEFRKSTFLYGVIFFLLGHISYIAGFLKIDRKLKPELLLLLFSLGWCYFFRPQRWFGRNVLPNPGLHNCDSLDDVASSKHGEC